MMNELKVINKSTLLGKEIDVYGTAEEPLFRAKDVAEWIEHSNITDMLALVDDDEKGVRDCLTPGGNQQVWFLTEDGLYEVLMQSRKPIAKQFKKGVKEILKSIRKTGVYVSSEAKDRTDILVTWVKGVQEILHLNNAAALALLKKGGEPLGLPIPDYVEADNVSHSVSELLKRNGIKLSAQAFNKLLETNGMIRRETRKSRSKGKDHRYWVVTDKGGFLRHKFHFSRKSAIRTPYWYDDKFSELCRAVGVIMEV